MAVNCTTLHSFYSDVCFEKYCGVTFRLHLKALVSLRAHAFLLIVTVVVKQNGCSRLLVCVWQEPAKEIRRLAEFLGVGMTVADTVAEKTSFSAMQKYKTQFDMDSIKRFFDGNKANENIFRKGTYIRHETDTRKGKYTDTKSV